MSVPSPQVKAACVIVAVIVGLSVAVGRHKQPASIRLQVPFAAAQTPADNKIHIEPVSSAGPGEAEAGWSQFKVSLPPHAPLLDLHIGLLIDNTGSEQVQERTSPWPQSFPIKFKLDTDDDSHVKTILKAQGLPTKDNRVTYRFQMAMPSGSVSFYDTVKYEHGTNGVGENTGGSTQQAGIGDKMVLMDEIQGDSSLHSLTASGLGSIKHIASLDALPPGKAHRFTVYLQFTPHHGPPRNAGISKGIKRD